MTLKQINQWFCDLIFPKKCLGCQNPNSYLCAQCSKNIPIKHSLTCPVCNQPITIKKAHPHCQTSLNGLIINSDWHNNLLKKIVYAFKYEFIKELQEPLAQVMINSLKQNIFIQRLKKPPLIIPIPLHPRRLRWRNFNQSELLAKEISQTFHWPMINNLLLRQKHTKPQMGIDNIEKRQQNIKEAFLINPSLKNDFSYLSKRTIFLLDDVCTSGATMESAAICLKKAFKPGKIYGLALARA